jgi:hypothetical protein
MIAAWRARGSFVADPHVEGVVRHVPVSRRAVAVETLPALAGFVAALVLAIAFLLAAGWFSAASESDAFSSGVFVAAVVCVADLATKLGELGSIRRWERRNGRILRSLLLGDEECAVFYAERSAQTA